MGHPRLPLCVGLVSQDLAPALCRSRDRSGRSRSRDRHDRDYRDRYDQGGTGCEAREGVGESQSVGKRRRRVRCS